MGGFHCLAVVNDAAVNMGVHCHIESLLLIVVGIYPEAELLDYVVILSLIF